MRILDYDFVEDLIERLSRIAPGAKPGWGRLDAPGMIAHLTDAVRFSMGRAGRLPDQSTWFSRNVIGPLLLYGVLRFPKNVQLPRPEGGPGPANPEGDLDILHAVLEDYLRRVETGELEPPPHPSFGAIGVDGWARLHIAHFEHHLRQFGA